MDDLSAARQARHRRERRRFDRDVRQAGLHCTPRELLDLERLVRAVNAGTLPVHDAHELVLHLRRTQAA